MHTQALITEADEELRNAYFVKQEAMNNHHFHNAISSEEYNSQSSSEALVIPQSNTETLVIPQTNSVIPTIEQNIPVVGVAVSTQQEKLYHCHINFEGHQKNVENTEMVPQNTQPVTCSQELIPVTNIIEEVCTMETELSAENQVKDNMNYFNFIKCESSLKGNPLVQENLQEGPLAEEETLIEESLIDEPLTEECLSEESQRKESHEEVCSLQNSNRKQDLILSDSFSNEESLEADKQSLKFKCEICLKSYSTEKCFKRHQWIHKNQHKCDVCFKSFNELESLEKHKDVHTKKPYACQLCHASFCKSDNLLKHLSTHSEKNFELSDVDNDKIDMDQQISQNKNSDLDSTNEADGFESAPKIFKCEECGKYCSTLKNLKRHTLIHGERKYSCTVCKKWFFRPDTLKKHAERHGHGLLDNIIDHNKLYESDDDFLPNDSNHSSVKLDDDKKEESEEEGNGNVYKCLHCEKVMTSKRGLRRHVALHKPKPEPSVCEICNKVFASSARLTIHLKTHNKPKEKVTREYLCHICSKVYPSNSSLTYHMRTHTGVKPHVCKICNSGFTTTTSLANHTRIHTGDRPFVCHVCSAAFAVSSAFRRHLTRHTGEANYLCKTCGKAFKRLSTLKEHTYTHSGEKPYVCKTCGAAYSHSGSLFAHQKRCKAQYTDHVVIEDSRVVIDNHDDAIVHHHIHVNNMQNAVRPLAVIGPIF